MPPGSIFQPQSAEISSIESNSAAQQQEEGAVQGIFSGTVPSSPIENMSNIQGGLVNNNLSIYSNLQGVENSVNRPNNPGKSETAHPI